MQTHCMQHNEPPPIEEIISSLFSSIEQSIACHSATIEIIKTALEIDTENKTQDRLTDSQNLSGMHPATTWQFQRALLEVSFIQILLENQKELFGLRTDKDMHKTMYTQISSLPLCKQDLQPILLALRDKVEQKHTYLLQKRALYNDLSQKLAATCTSGSQKDEDIKNFYMGMRSMVAEFMQSPDYSRHLLQLQIEKQ